METTPFNTLLVEIFFPKIHLILNKSNTSNKEIKINLNIITNVTNLIITNLIYEYMYICFFPLSFKK